MVAKSKHFGEKTMTTPNFVILYVDQPQQSGVFYNALLGREPVQSSPNFVLFALDNGLMLGLWSRHTVEPAASAAGGGGEIAFAVGDIAAVEATHTEWARRGLKILQTPVELDFGHTFVALDPDGHRLRVFCPNQS
jgi:catechol 2,3-dioxygenase-like lactoylglutathione lyase family enzyme